MSFVYTGLGSCDKTCDLLQSSAKSSRQIENKQSGCPIGSLTIRQNIRNKKQNNKIVFGFASLILARSTRCPTKAYLWDREDNGQFIGCIYLYI